MVTAAMKTAMIKTLLLGVCRRCCCFEDACHYGILYENPISFPFPLLDETTVGNVKILSVK